MPTAKPTGHRLGGGSCGRSSPGRSSKRSLPYVEAAGFNRCRSGRVNDVTVGATRPRGVRRPRGSAPRPYSSQRSSTRRRTSSLISISGGHAPRALLRALVRRVDPELAAVELQRRRVVEVVERALADQHVALRVDVGADAEEDLLVVVHVDPLVDDHDRLRQAEQPEAPDRVHHLLRVAGEALADRDDAAVVERARDRQVVVDDLGDAHPDRRQEDPLGRLAEPRVLLRRLADHDRRVDRVAPHRHRGHVEDRERLGRRVVAGVVAERAFLGQLVLGDVALEHDLGVGRAPRGRRSSPARARPARRAGSPASMSSSTCFGQRRARAVGGDGVEPERDRDLELAVGEQVVGAAVLVDLPVHRRRALVEHLQAVHADVAAAACAGPS